MQSPSISVRSSALCLFLLDYITSLRANVSGDAYNLIDYLVKLLTQFSVPHNASLYSTSNNCVPTGHVSDECQDSNSSQEKDRCFSSVESASETQQCAVTDDLVFHDKSFDDFVNLKNQYLSLTAESMCHVLSTTEWLQGEELSDQSTNVLRERLAQHPLVRLSLFLFLHPAFNREDHAWLVSALQSYRKSLVADVSQGKESCSSSEGCDELYDHSRDMLPSTKWLDCFLEITADLSSIVHFLGSDNFRESSSTYFYSFSFLCVYIVYIFRCANFNAGIHIVTVNLFVTKG